LIESFPCHENSHSFLKLGEVLLWYMAGSVETYPVDVVFLHERHNALNHCIHNSGVLRFDVRKDWSGVGYKPAVFDRALVGKVDCAWLMESRLGVERCWEKVVVDGIVGLVCGQVIDDNVDHERHVPFMESRCKAFKIIWGAEMLIYVKWVVSPI
jgi:hypothetical protein